MCLAGVILLRSPFYAILSLILTFFFVSGLCLAFGCEFLALLLIFVYVGSISILFLFAAMFLDLWAFRLNSFGFYFSRHIAPAFWLILWFVTIFQPWTSVLSSETSSYQFQWLDLYTARSNVSHLNQLGLFLYTDYSLPFLLAALQLLVAMIAAIVISLVFHLVVIGPRFTTFTFLGSNTHFWS